MTLTQDANGGVFDTISQTYVDACQASWFVSNGTISGGWTPPLVVQPASPATVNATVYMPANATVNQTACAGLSPQFTVSVS